MLWIGAIFLFSTDAFSASRTGTVLGPLLRRYVPSMGPSWVTHIHYFVRKGAHITEYAVLGLLLLRALRADSLRWVRLRWVASTLTIVAACAILDEYHQSFTWERTASVADSLIDIVGGSAVLLLGIWRDRATPGSRRRCCC